MYFGYIRNSEFPVLAWVARLTQGDERIEVTHGGRVETRDDFFVEGAWRGSFGDGGLDESDVLLGSGGRRTEDRFIAASATHTLERLHTLHTGSTLYVSNSLALLLAASGDDLRDDYSFYDIDLLSFVEGMPGATTTLPTQRGFQINLHYCQNIIVDKALTIREVAKTDHVVRPGSYTEYVDFLNTVTAETTANARAVERSVRYTPLATVSTGYDSPACAILARRVGAETAVTFSQARSDFESDDSGTRIGKHLGFDVLEFSRTEYLTRTDLPEAEFLAAGTGGEDVVMAALEKVLPGTILFTGYRGDAIWGLHGNPDDSTRYRMKDPSGASLSEFRLRVGFIHFPIPQSHQRLHPLLHRISHSAEMAAWRRGGSYDRPIPRRIIESENVPGDWFGRTKKAITQPFYHGDAIDPLLSDAAREELRTYCRDRNITLKNGPQRLLRVFQLADQVTWHLPVLRSDAWRLLRKGWLNPNYVATMWAVRHLRSQYARALRA